MILIIAPDDDIHALSVAKSVHDQSKEVRVCIFDSAEFPLNASIAISPDGWVIDTREGRKFASEEVTALWWRRPRAPGLSDTLIDPTARRFAASECSRTFESIASWPGYLVVNPVDKEDLANKKALQLRAATARGLKVPQTIITNGIDAFRQFQAIVDGDIVFKVQTSPISSFAETRRFRTHHDNKLPSLIHAPVIFQEEIRKKQDIRVTIIRDHLFAAAVVPQNPLSSEYPDWKLDPSALCFAHQLPHLLAESLKGLVADLGLYYAAIDLIQTPESEYYFLEANPSGQFLFVEIDTGQPLSASFARLLLEGSQA